MKDEWTAYTETKQEMMMMMIGMITCEGGGGEGRRDVFVYCKYHKYNNAKGECLVHLCKVIRKLSKRNIEIRKCQRESIGSCTRNVWKCLIYLLWGISFVCLC